MREEDSTFGAEPQHLDRLLALGLEEGGEEAAAPAGPELEQPGGRIGRYQLLQVLGEGGMGVVYLAQQTEPVRRQVALKIIKPGMDSKRVLARFEGEEQALALMEHPHVARVYDAGLAPSGRPYFVMEHVKGLPITTHCDRHQLTIEERLHLFLHVCEAVQHAHQKGIVHRDLKPSNILVVVEGQEMIPKVIDFGVARALGQPLTERTLYTEQGQLIGTPEYMSPEQAYPTSQDIDTRTDVYSLGVVLYELLAGLLPFDPKTFRDGGVDHIRKVICDEEPKTPSTRLSRTSAEESAASARRRRTDARTLRRKLHGDLDWITLKAMEKDRTRRYATVDALATDIRNYLSHQPVSAAPPRTLYRARKFARRHRQALGALSVSVLLLMGGLATTIMYVRVAREHALARSDEHQRRLSNAQMLLGSKRYQEALAHLDALLDSRYVGREAQLAHARVLLEQNNLAAARGELEGLLDKADEIAGQAHFLLANFYFEPDPWDPNKTQDYKVQWESHRRQAEELIADTAEYHFLQAKASHDGWTIAHHLGEALEIDKDHYDSLRERAHLYRAQEDYARMGEDASQMIGIRGGDPGGWLLRAIARREQGRWKEALEDHDEAVALAPNDAAAHLERAETYLRMGRYEAALADAQQAAQLDPASLYCEVMAFVARAAVGRYEEAERQYERLTSRPLTPTEAKAYLAGAIVPMGPKGWFDWYAAEIQLRSHAWACALPVPSEERRAGAFWAMREAARYYERLSRHGRWLARAGEGGGGPPCWSPDGTKIAYTQGLMAIWATAILDWKTGATELLTIPGNNPQWSPDGRYIAFARLRENLSIDAVTSGIHSVEKYRAASGEPGYEEQVWIIDLTTRALRRIAKGNFPTWSLDSKRVYFTSGYASRPGGATVSWVSLADDPPVPRQVFTGCESLWPAVSPDEQYIADAGFRRVRILDMQSHEQVREWILPSFFASRLRLCWSPNSRELSVGGLVSGMLGLWILDVQTGKARRMLDGPVAWASWSPDRTRMAVSLDPPCCDLWLFDLDPNRPTAESLGEARTVEEHCREVMEYYTRGVAADPNDITNHLLRADAALWINDGRASEYLKELEGTCHRSPYHAGACVERAQAILAGPPELRDRLWPLAVVLARVAIEKEPDHARTLADAFDRAGRPEEAAQFTPP